MIFLFWSKLLPKNCNFNDIVWIRQILIKPYKEIFMQQLIPKYQQMHKLL